MSETNFGFLRRDDRCYDLFANAAIDAEKLFHASPEMCAVCCRKALELAVRWVYAADSSLDEPYRSKLSTLVLNESFKQLVDHRVWVKLKHITQCGNSAVHTGKRVAASDAMLSLRFLFDFVNWIDYRYGSDYAERFFDEGKVPPAGVPLTEEQIQAIKSQGELIARQDETIKELECQVRAMRDQLAATKEESASTRSFNPEEISEYETRVRYIDVDLQMAGWELDVNVVREREVAGMPVEPGNDTGVGFVDYVLLGKDGKPLAIVEAKRTMYSPEKGLQQARLYAQCLEAEYGYRPPIFLSNGFDVMFCDDVQAPKRRVSGFFSQAELQTILARRETLVPLDTIQVNEEIAGRYYQIRAIRKVCKNIEAGYRKSLLVMATGTGKTRVSAGLIDVLMRGNRIKNALFLADRVALVEQAKTAYQEYLPDVSLCNLCKNKEDRNARVVFSTYPTILNAIDAERDESGVRLFTPAHFDLIVVDEAHRSIFNKYRSIFEHFDALVLGLTATPADEVDRNTYEFFEVERGVPTDVYTYEEAVDKGYLVDFYGIETHTSFLDEGITYDDLSDEDKETLEEDFEETGQDVPDYIAPTEINNWVFNEQTVDAVLQTLMEKGIRVDGGQTLGKTIIFAQSRDHARFIVKRFEKLYPYLSDGYIKCVVHGDDYSHTIITEFKYKPRPVVAVSVDMMDTGVDVPEVVNLVFFKKVRSKIKFWQMIGRGTRTCEGLAVVDPFEGERPDKERFFIFDWCRNFEFFRENGNVVEGKTCPSLAERVFQRKVKLVKELQTSAFADDDFQSLREDLVEAIHFQVVELNEELVSVRLHRRAVEKFKQRGAYTYLGDLEVSTLQGEIAPLVRNAEEDVYALRFDSLMYGFMCALCDGINANAYRRKLVDIALDLQQRITIPQVKEKLPVLQRVSDDAFYEEVSILALEEVRKELRGIVKFLKDSSGRKAVQTSLADPVTKIVYGVSAGASDDFADYEQKVSHYLKEYANSTVVYKLRHNMPMTEFEYGELERIFTEELGTAEDYENAFGDTPFGILIRKTFKLDRNAAMDAFAGFLNDQSLTEHQIDFVNRVVDHIVANGYMEPTALRSAPFDRPQSFVRLFDEAHQASLVGIIREIKRNAEEPAA